jgi:hypothetical protein
VTPDDVRNRLVDLVCALTHLERRPVQDVLMALDVGGHGVGDVEALRNHVRQVPLSDADRGRWLSDLDAIESSPNMTPPAMFATVGRLLRHGDARTPILDRDPVPLPPLTAQLSEALEVLTVLDREVRQPWALIGGLMVLVTCAEHGRRFDRATVDADVVVGVFTHRSALRRLTSQLRGSGFDDDTPDPATSGERLAYRWRRDGVVLDVAVPPKVNEQDEPPTTVVGRKSVALPGTQQALRRTERLPVRLQSGVEGYVRRPDLLGAVVLKSIAAATDRRDEDRHREDLVMLADLLALTGCHVAYRAFIRSKDAHRIAAATALVTRREWRAADDPDAARAALDYLAAPLAREHAT